MSVKVPPRSTAKRQPRDSSVVLGDQPRRRLQKNRSGRRIGRVNDYSADRPARCGGAPWHDASMADDRRRPTAAAILAVVARDTARPGDDVRQCCGACRSARPGAARRQGAARTAGGPAMCHGIASSRPPGASRCRRVRRRASARSSGCNAKASASCAAGSTCERYGWSAAPGDDLDRLLWGGERMRRAPAFAGPESLIMPACAWS